MGYGVLPDGALAKTSYFKNLLFDTDSQKDIGLEKNIGHTFTTKQEYYGAEYYEENINLSLKIVYLRGLSHIMIKFCSM